MFQAPGQVGTTKLPRVRPLFRRDQCSGELTSSHAPTVQTETLDPQEKEHDFFPPVSELDLKLRFPPSQKRKTMPLSQPRSSQPCPKEPAMQEPRETCWEEAGAWGAGDLGLNPPGCCLNQGHSPFPF